MSLSASTESRKNSGDIAVTPPKSSIISYPRDCYKWLPDGNDHPYTFCLFNTDSMSSIYEVNCGRKQASDQRLGRGFHAFSRFFWDSLAEQRQPVSSAGLPNERPLLACWCPTQERPWQLAMGTSNGVLKVYSPRSTEDISKMEGKMECRLLERPFYGLSWNPEQNLLLGSLQFLSKHSSVKIWDLGCDSLDPVYRYISGDDGLSVLWLQSYPGVFAVSTSAGNVHIVDTKASSTKSQMTLSSFCTASPDRWSDKTRLRRVINLCESPLFTKTATPAILTGHTQDTVLFWDLREYSKPTLELIRHMGSRDFAKTDPPTTVSSIRWCPSRRYHLGLLPQNSRTIQLYDFYKEDTFAERERVLFKLSCVPQGGRVVTVNANHPISSFDFFKAQKSKFPRGWQFFLTVTVSPKGERHLAVHELSERRCAVFLPPSAPHLRAQLSSKAEKRIKSCTTSITASSELVDFDEQNSIFSSPSSPTKADKLAGHSEKTMDDSSRRASRSWPVLGTTRNIGQLVFCGSMRRDWQDVFVKRACKRYGQKKDALKNLKFLRKSDRELQAAWRWVAYRKALKNNRRLHDLQCSFEPDDTLSGVWSLFSSDRLQSDVLHDETRTDVGYLRVGNANVKTFSVYLNDRRAVALMLCDRYFGDPNNCSNVGPDRVSLQLDTRLKRLEQRGLYEQAAFLALYHLKLDRAIQALNSGASHSQQLGLASLAVAGIPTPISSNDPKTMNWRNLWQRIYKQITNPYLQSIFAFLIAASEPLKPSRNSSTQLKSLLENDRIQLADRLALALRFLDDTADYNLNSFLRKVKDNYVKKGLLDGLLLTGLNDEGLVLLQNYLNRTCDIQSALFLAVSEPSLLQHPTVILWADIYRDMLDSWGMWTERAIFDVLLGHPEATQRPPTSMDVLCSFCSLPIVHTVPLPECDLGSSSASQTLSPGSFVESPRPPSKGCRNQACSNCNKPLPRCSVCLRYMEVPLEAGQSKSGEESGSRETPMDQSAKARKHLDSSQFDNSFTSDYDLLSPQSRWFVWCQSCKHGGHAVHMRSWFKEQSDCPVSNCHCECGLGGNEPMPTERVRLPTDRRTVRFTAFGNGSHPPVDGTAVDENS